MSEQKDDLPLSERFARLYQQIALFRSNIGPKEQPYLEDIAWSIEGLEKLIQSDRKERDKRLADRLDKIRLELCISHKANEKTTTGKKDCKEGNWHWNADLYNIVAELDRSEAKQE